MSVDPQILRQATIFNSLWGKFSEQVGSGKGMSDFPTEHAMVPKYVTTVTRVPDGIAQNMELVGQEIMGKHPGHYLYPSHDLHFTFINLDAFFPNGLQRQHEAVIQSLGNALKNLPPLELEAKGVGVFPTTIFVQLYDKNGLIEQYRAAINNAVREVVRLPAIENKSVAEHVAFVNLIRFKEAPQKAILDIIKPIRNTDFGTFIAPELELVTTNRLLSPQSTITHRIFPLNQ